MRHSLLTSYELQTRKGKKILVLVKGEPVYRSILERALPRHRLSRMFNDDYSAYDWGIFVYNADSSVKTQLESLLEMFKKHVYIHDDDLTEIFALDFHMNPGGQSRTKIGELVYQAKYQRNREQTQALSVKISKFIQQHPTYTSADAVIAIPSSSGRSFNVPLELAKYLAKELKIDNLSDEVEKTRKTKPMKDCTSIEEKIENVRDAFALTENAKVTNRTIILIDDIYQTGFTMNEVARVLLENKVNSVLGLAGTKTTKDL